MRIPLAVIHLLALAIAVGSVFVRARSAHRLKDGPDALAATFTADNWWGISALLAISTGLWRWFGSMEKSAGYYMTNHVFYAKMGLLVVILLLELWPMVTLIRWRIASRRGTLPPMELATRGPRIARISDVQLLLLLGMLVSAVLLARGYGAR